MEIIIIPGFTGFPEETTFLELEEILTNNGHNVHKLAWPNFPEELDKYNFTSMINYSRHFIQNLVNTDDLIILGFSMGGIIAALLAAEFSLKSLGLIVTPYQAGSEDDLAKRYQEWKGKGSQTFTSSKYGELTIPFSFIEDAQKYNSLNFIKQVNCPVLFIAGEDDKNVPWQTAKKLFDAAAEPKEWHLILGMGHRYKNRPEKLKEVNKIILRFIDPTIIYNR